MRLITEPLEHAAEHQDKHDAACQSQSQRERVHHAHRRPKGEADTCQLPRPRNGVHHRDYQGDDLRFQVSAAKYNVHYVMLWPGSTPTDGWYAVMSSADSINAAGGSVRDTLPPNPNGSASGTVRASGHWSC